MEEKKTVKKVTKKPVTKKSQAVKPYPVPAMINKKRVIEAIKCVQECKEYESLVPFLDELILYVRNRKYFT